MKGSYRDPFWYRKGVGTEVQEVGDRIEIRRDFFLPEGHFIMESSIKGRRSEKDEQTESKGGLGRAAC